MSLNKSAEGVLGVIRLWVSALIQAFMLWFKCIIFDSPWFILVGPRDWLNFHMKLAELIFVLERRHIADPDKTGSLPHVNTLSMAGAGSAKMMGGSEYEEPIVKDLVLVGAGHAHAFVLKMFGMQPETNVRLTLISEGVDTPYSGMLPGFVSGVYSREECHIDVVRLAEFAKARLILGKALSIDDGVVVLENQQRVPYDVCSINIGSSPQLPEKGADLVAPVKPIANFSLHLDRITKRDSEGVKLRIAVVGGGAGGIELLLALDARLKNAKELVLVAKSDKFLSNHDPRVSALVMSKLTSRPRVTVKLNCNASIVEKSQDGQQRVLTLSNRGQQSKEVFDEIIWCTQASGQSLLRESEGFTVDDSGFVFVDEYLRVAGKTNVFAAGDCCHLTNNECPKAGVFAVRQGMPLAANLRSTLRCAPVSELQPYVPQRSFLGLIGTSDGKAIASKGSLGMEGEWLWNLKDWIDKKWMSGYTTALPTKKMMTAYGGAANLTLLGISQVALAAGQDTVDELCSAKMRCGGCGSKVGSSILSRVLKGVSVTKRDEVLLGLDQPDDCAMIQLSPTDKKMVQTVDFFRSFWRDEYVFGQIAVNHSLSDVHAMGAEPITAMCIVQVPFGSSKKVEQRLGRLMKGACDYLSAHGCSLIGGHTCEGAELAMGFSVTGVVDEKKHLLTKGGMRSGDVLILTKPLGTGVIMAAHMRLLARGVHVQDALGSMLTSNGKAGVCLRDFGATSCTDVTGFGLIGHLVEMMRASANKEKPLMANINLAKIPTLLGAEEIITIHQVLSSLQHENVRAAHLIRNKDAAAKQPKFPLLFDPQTAGGLLAAVSADRADACIAELQRLGYDRACIIGMVVENDNFDGTELVNIDV